MLNGLQKRGFYGTKLATTSGAIGGGLYGLTTSNKISEVPYNTTFGGVSGGALGGLGYVGYKGANNVYNNTMLPRYNSWQIGRGYDRLIKNPYMGSGKDVITKMKNHKGENVLLQRGEAIPGEGGNTIVYGRELKRATGTERNIGLNKAIYKHGMTREQAKMIPYNIKTKPVDISDRGQDIYETYMNQDRLKTIVSPYGKHKTIASFYKDIR